MAPATAPCDRISHTLFRYTANLARLGKPSQQVACYVRACHLVAPALLGALNYDLNALALLLRDWGTDDLLAQHSLVTCLIADNLNDLHPMIVQNPRAASIQIPQPAVGELLASLTLIESDYPKALPLFKGNSSLLANQLVGASVNSIEDLFKLKEHAGEAIQLADLVELKKSLVEKDCNGLIEFIDPKRTLDDFHGQEKLKTWLRQDVALWRQSQLQALPMGYLVCGPVGTGENLSCRVPGRGSRHSRRES